MEKEDAYDYLLSSVATKIRNSCREIPFPSDEQRRRWPWELIQNACDSIAVNPNRSDVDIKVLLYDDRVEFHHNGSPFTIDQLFSLIYMSSRGKENTNTIGQFGTGFISTLVVSMVVEIETNVIGKDGNSKRQRITLYRTGKTIDDVIDDIKKTVKSVEDLDEESEWTKFIYKFREQDNIKTAELGAKEFLQNIPKVMLFCRRIKSAKLEVNYSNYSSLEEKFKNNYISEFSIGSFQNIKKIGDYHLKECLVKQIENGRPIDHKFISVQHTNSNTFEYFRCQMNMVIT